MASSPRSQTCKYWIYSGAGNRFLLLSEVSVDQIDTNLVTLYCHWAEVDGLLCLNDSDIADARLVIFNSDGSRPGMCGNGLRCAVAHLAHELQKTDISVETDQGTYSGKFLSWDRVIIDMTRPNWDMKSHQINDPLPGMPSQFHSVHTGVPHAVVFVDKVECMPLQAWGSFLRWHQTFTPQGVNVNFVQKFVFDRLLVRTYERGLERESMACGTGALACALVATSNFRDQSEIKVLTRSRMQLKIFQKDSRIYVEGPVQCVLQGER